MPIVNYASKEIQFKIVYYGPALGGKTTNLAYIHSRITPAHRGDLVSLATAADRTLFFDFLPLTALTLQGFRTKFQLYFRNLEQNLQKQNLHLEHVPFVLQFNKRDIPSVAPINYLEYLLNNRKRRALSFESVAATGVNVFSTLDAVTQLLLHKFKRENAQLFAAPGGR
jgi:signal recognition particle receptor subunit beta